jgi:hypothetical protein
MRRFRAGDPIQTPDFFHNGEVPDAMPIRTLLFLSGLMLFTGPSGSATARGGLANHVYITTDTYGQVFVKSIPDEMYGSKGTTKVYRVGQTQDTLIQTYSWYSPRVFVASFGGDRDVYVVRTAPWHAGHVAAAGDPALAFFKNQSRLRGYSTLDIAGQPDRVSVQDDRYSPFSRLIGFRNPFGSQFVFDVERAGGGVLSFDAESGEILTVDEEAVRKQLFEARIRIARIKRRYYDQHRTDMPGIEQMLVEEKVLKDFAPDDYPAVPRGFRYVPDTVWAEVRFEKIGKK